MSEHLLEVKNLKVSFHTYAGEVQAVRGVSFKVNPGECMAIVGESGSGKTVTSKAVLGLIATPPGEIKKESEILFEGKDILKFTEKEWRAFRGKEAAMIFQDPMTSLNPTMKVGKQIMESIILHNKVSKSEAREQAIELLRKVNIPNPEDRLNQYPYEFSGGMRQRSVLAVALAADPKILIADEPTTALDVTIQAQILELMKKLQKTNQMGIIFITHNLGVVAEICDKVSVMYAGKMVEQGPVDDIFYAPGHPYTRGLLRSMPRVDAESYERLIPIEGTPVDMLNPPEGCPFAPRCESAMKICLQKMPPYVELGDNHRAACWLCVQEQMKAQKAAEKNNEKTEAGSHE